MGNELSYAFGQCTYFVAKTFDWVPAGLGNAGDWLVNAQNAGLQTTNIPTPGSVVVYNAGQGYSPFGHVATVDSLNGDGTFNVSEMNFAGWGQVDQRKSTLSDVAGFILPPGGKPDTGGQWLSNIPVVGGVLGAGATAGAASARTAVNVGKITGWIVDKRNWWKIFFIAGGAFLIYNGVVIYLIKEEEPEIRAVSKEAVAAA